VRCWRSSSLLRRSYSPNGRSSGESEKERETLVVVILADSCWSVRSRKAIACFQRKFNFSATRTTQGQDIRIVYLKLNAKCHRQALQNDVWTLMS